MTIVWRAVHDEMTRARVERQSAVRAGAQFAAALGVKKALSFCAREGISVKAAGEGSNSPGAFLVPEELDGAIQAYRSQMGVIRREAGVVGMGSDTRTFPRRLTGATANFVLENQPASETQVPFDSVTLRARKALAFLRLSSELLEDALADLGQWLTEELGFALTELEDSCGWQGDASPAYGGMTGIAFKLSDGAHAGGVVASAGHDALSKVDAADIEALQAKLPEQYLAGAKWFASAVGVSALMRLGALPFGSTETPHGVRPLLQFAGHEIVATPKLAGAGSQSGKAMLAFGDMRQTVAFGERRGIAVKVSQQRYLEQDQIALKATARFEIIAHNVGGASAPGAMVALLGA